MKRSGMANRGIHTFVHLPMRNACQYLSETGVSGPTLVSLLRQAVWCLYSLNFALADWRNRHAFGTKRKQHAVATVEILIVGVIVGHRISERFLQRQVLREKSCSSVDRDVALSTLGRHYLGGCFPPLFLLQLFLTLICPCDQHVVGMYTIR